MEEEHAPVVEDLEEQPLAPEAPAPEVPVRVQAVGVLVSSLKRAWWLANHATPVLLVLLVVGGYYIVTLRDDVSDLRRDVGDLAAAPAPQAAAARPTATAAPSPPPALTAGDHVRGSRSATVLLIEYSDLECPFCKVHHATLKQLVGDYGGQVAWVYRHLPLSFHANAQKEAEAAECAADLGGEEKFWEYVDAIVARTTSNGTGFPLTGLVPLASELGLSEAQFGECLNSGARAAHVRDEAAGGTRAGLTGTPSTFIARADGSVTRLAVGALPIQDLKTAIDSILKK